MADSWTAIDAARLGRAVRQACVEAALAGHEDASIRGLCHEGAWEAAVAAIQRVDPLEVARSAPPDDATGTPPAAATAVTATGTIAADLLEQVALRAAREGPEAFRRRARHIATRAASLAAALADAGRPEAGILQALAGGPDAEWSSEARQRASGHWLEVSIRCTHAAAFAAEVAAQVDDALHVEARTTLRLAWSAAECALEASEAWRHPAREQEWTRRQARRAWRARRVLQRALPIPHGEPTP